MNLVKLGVVIFLLTLTMNSCSDDEDVQGEQETKQALSLEKELQKANEELEAAKERILELENSDVLAQLEEKLNVFELNQKTLDANEALVKNFYQEVFGDLNSSAIDKYIGDVYIQHHIGLPDGKEALRNIINAIKSSGAPTSTIQVETAFSRNDLVFIQILSNNGKNRTMDVFRIEDHLLVEHWDAFTEVD